MEGNVGLFGEKCDSPPISSNVPTALLRSHWVEISTTLWAVGIRTCYHKC